MTKVLIAGGGLAGLSAAAALGGAGFDVELFEARPFLGGRATSYAAPASEDGADPEIIDNCQHILLRCCVNLLDFYNRLGVRDRIKFYREFYFLEPGGRMSVLTRGKLPAPFHFTGAFLKMHCLARADKMAIGEKSGITIEHRSLRQRMGLASVMGLWQPKGGSGERKESERDQQPEDRPPAEPEQQVTAKKRSENWRHTHHQHR